MKQIWYQSFLLTFANTFLFMFGKSGLATQSDEVVHIKNKWTFLPGGRQSTHVSFFVLPLFFFLSSALSNCDIISPRTPNKLPKGTAENTELRAEQNEVRLEGGAEESI